MNCSVVIITHDRLHHLENAIKTVDSQRRRPEEIIVVDDGSPTPIEPRLAPRLPELTTIPVRFVRTDDLGPSGARNAGAEAASGRVMAFLDDDDLWHEDYLATALDRLDDRNADVVFTWMDNKTGQTVSPGKHLPPDFPKQDYFRSNLGVTGSNILVLAKAYRAMGGFDAELLASEDKDFLIRCLEADLTVDVLQQPLVYHCIYDTHSQLSGNNVNRFKLSGKRLFLERHGHKMPRATRNHLKGQLGYYYVLKGGGLAREGWALILRNAPSFILKVIRHRLNAA